MDKENDIFNPNSKIQNMNFLFEEDETTMNLEETQTFPASRRSRSTAASEPAPVRQTAPRKARPVEARPVEARPIADEDDFFQTRAVLANKAEPAPMKEQASVRPRSVQPEEARPRRVQTQDAQPRRAQAQDAQPRRTQAASQREGGNARRSSEQQGARRAQSADARRTADQRQAQDARRSADQRQVQDARRSADQRQTQDARRSADQRQVQDARRASDDRQAQNRASQQKRSAQPQRRAQDPGRVNRASAGRSNVSGGSRGRRTKKRGSGFKKFIIIYAAILLVLLVVGMIIFSSFLKSLEKSQPTNIAAEVAENFKSDKVSSYLKDNVDAINCFGDPENLISACAENLQNVEKVSYIENKDYRADAPSYNITADGKTVAKVTLAKAGSGSFGLSKWKMESLDIADYLDTASFEFLAPVGTTITIDGTELDDKFLTGEEGIPEMLQIASKYVTVPSFLTYKVAGIAGTPQIVAKDASGSDLKLTATEDKYVIGSETDDAFVKSVKPLVENALESWGKHFINMGGNLSAYIMEDSDWYSYIFGGPDMDPILTSLYEFESIADYEFTEKKVDNFIKYTDDCFTVDVSYKMKIDFTTDQMSDENQQLDATWVFVTKNNGEDWYIVDCIYK